MHEKRSLPWLPVYCIHAATVLFVGDDGPFLHISNTFLPKFLILVATFYFSTLQCLYNVNALNF